MLDNYSGSASAALVVVVVVLANDRLLLLLVVVFTLIIGVSHWQALLLRVVEGYGQLSKRFPRGFALQSIERSPVLALLFWAMVSWPAPLWLR